ncbi:metal ABC transporter solute-binding protein, Zn/Mn family [Vallitalea okinawensis]|uniref:metal ABC transporter solute-binding protein, Zn/Mn family n=1 Tax=Vallitalea okinawensis TaxID=2078660 RepID=UPI000CFE34D5|nr:zinc ABC transporter substrate-binding protein [Vallitalea okinawensis]
MRIKKISINLLIMIFLLAGCTTEGQETKLYNDQMTVAVSIPPQKAFVEAISEGHVDVVTMIPPGSSPANYQPTAKQMQGLSEAAIYYTIEVPAEVAFIQPKIKDFNKDIKIVDLFEEVEEIYPVRNFEDEHDEHDEHDEELDTHDENEDHNDDVDEHDDNDEHVDGEDIQNDHDHTGSDPHIWLSPARVQVMVQSIADSLSEIDPSRADVYKENADNYIKELQELDTYIQNNVKSGASFIMYHPSLGYFADDYGLNMTAIEVSGKEATAKEMESIIDYAKQEGIKVIFYQAEFSSKQAEIIAKEIGGSVMQIDILSEDYINNMKNITDTIAKNSN